MADTFRLCWVNHAGGELVYHVRARVTLGRAPENEVVVDEEGVSRRHCAFSIRDGALHVEDLGSTNGTHVNGQRVQQAVLQDGDEVLVGRSLFRVAGADLPAGGVTRAVGSATIEVALRAAQAEYPGNLDPAARAADHLRTLCRVIDAINAGGSPEHLWSTALEALLDTLDVDSGAVVLGTDPAAEPAASVRRGEAAPPSRTVLRRVLETGEAVLANDVLEDVRLRAARSVIGSATERILCAPMTVAGRTAGALYLASCGSGRPAGEPELRLVTLVARQLALAAENLHRQELVLAENRSLKDAAGAATEIVGTSEPLTRALDVARRAARADVTVLLTGETGTGKELFARALHAWSRRHDRPFVAINCGAIPATMVESELFGHERGAFTGAVERRLGRFEMARDGTLFLDEIGDLPADVQVKLLRVLEEKRFYRVGGSKEIAADVRLVCATNRDLDRRVAEGSFRADLLFRIRVIEVAVPPLRERVADVPELARHLLDRLARDAGLPAPRLTEQALRRLQNYDWPGNVRELRNVLERALILCGSDTIDAGDVLSAGEVTTMPRRSGGSPPILRSLKEVEKEHVQAVLDATGWNKSKAAEVLGIGRTNIYEKIRQYGLEPSG